MSFSAAENDRRSANTILLGRVTAVNGTAGRARVQCGDLATPELPVGQLRAGPLSFWWMPAVGEQVVVACPSGDVARGVIIAAVFAGNAPSADAGTPMIDLAGGRMLINGTLELTGDVIAGGVSLRSHTHGGVMPGGSSTGGPN